MDEIIGKFIKKGDLEDCATELSMLVNERRSGLIVQLVEFLEPLLTNNEPFERERGVALLASVLSKCNADALTQQEATVMIEFFLSRLDDQVSVGSLMNGTLALLRLGVVSKTEQIAIPQRIFLDLNVQNYPQNVRNVVFKIFQVLLEQNVEGLSKINQEFIAGFVRCVDGEKDPRNLLLLFQLARLVTLELDIKDHAQGIFEVIFCYFPITFRPAPDDPYGITAIQLKEALQDVVTSSPLYCIHAIPVLMEKLSSTSSNAKKDAMDTLAACFPVYTGQPFIPHLAELWGYLRTEMAQSVDEANELAALKCIRLLTRALSSSVASSKQIKTPLDLFLELIISDCLDNLEGEMKYGKPCGKILMASCSATKSASNKVVEVSLPTLMKRYEDEESQNKKKVLLDVVVDLLMASRLVGSAPFFVYKDALVDAFLAVLISASYTPLKVTAIKGMFEMIASKDLLVGDEIELLLSHLNDISIRKGVFDMNLEALSSLSQIALLDPILIQSKSLEYFFDHLDTNSELVLKALRKISVTRDLLKITLDRLYQVLDGPLFIPILETIYALIETCKDDQRAEQLESLYSLIDNKNIFEMITKEDSKFSLIVALVVRSLDPQSQSQFVMKLVAFNESKTIPSTDQVAFLFQCVMCNCRPETDFGIVDLKIFIRDLIDAAISKRSHQYVTSAATIISSLLNKRKGDHSDVIQLFKETYIGPMIMNEGCDILIRRELLRVLSWIGKAYVYRAHPIGNEIVELILSLLSNPALANSASDGIENIVKDDAVLSRPAFGVQKILFKQKLYNSCIPKLLAGFQDDTQEKTFYLLALAHLLRNVSKSTLVNELPKLFAMLIHSLKSTDSRLKLSTLDTFMMIVECGPSIIADNIEVVITSISALTDPKENDVLVRVSAVKFLGLLIGKVEYSLIAPFKVVMLQRLGKCLDDHKLVVRKEAANTRGKWYLLIGKSS